MSRLLIGVVLLGHLSLTQPVILAPPVQVKFSSTDYRNVLHWTPAPNSSSLQYDVQWKIYGEVDWLDVDGCQNIQKLHCDLSAETSQPTEWFYARVRASGPASGPGSGPASGPASNPASDPGSGPASGPGSSPASGPGSGPASGPASNPASGPGSGPGSGPASSPASGPASGPGSGPGSGPASSIKSAWTLSPRFSPRWDTVISPPVLKLSVSQQSIMVRVKPPRTLVRKIHNNLQYNIYVTHKSGQQEVFQIRCCSNKLTLKNLDQGSQYCLQAQTVVPLQAKTSARSSETCVTTL